MLLLQKHRHTAPPKLDAVLESQQPLMWFLWGVPLPIMSTKRRPIHAVAWQSIWSLSLTGSHALGRPAMPWVDKPCPSLSEVADKPSGLLCAAACGGWPLVCPLELPQTGVFHGEKCLWSSPPSTLSCWRNGLIGKQHLFSLYLLLEFADMEYLSQWNGV